MPANRLLEGPGLLIAHCGEELRLSPGQAVCRPADAGADPDVADLPRAA
jgi:hypothetical protein